MSSLFAFNEIKFGVLIEQDTPLRRLYRLPRLVFIIAELPENITVNVDNKIELWPEHYEDGKLSKVIKILKSANSKQLPWVMVIAELDRSIELIKTQYANVSNLQKQGRDPRYKQGL